MNAFWSKFNIYSNELHKIIFIKSSPKRIGFTVIFDKLRNLEKIITILF